MVTASRRKARAGTLDGYEAFVDTVLRDWRVPGAAIAVVQGGDVPLLRGFGYRDAAERRHVSEHTLFPLASVTKAFTTASIAVLVDDGLLSWDTPVREYLPGFRLGDDLASERITPRDLVTHRSGLPRHDLLWYHSAGTREELVERLRYLEPTADFRSFWQYQNLMYMAAGYLVGQVAGSTWEEVVQSRLFDPLGMIGSVFSVETAQATPDHALPYSRSERSVDRIPFYAEQQALGPAGSIVSSVDDMSRWLRLHLEAGRAGERQVISDMQVALMHSAQMVSSQPRRWPETGPESYGLGWFVERYRGRRLVQHGGNIDGFSTLCALLPDDGIGVVVLTNLNGNPTPYILAWNAFDRLLGLDPLPWSDRYRALRRSTDAAVRRGTVSRARQRVRRTRPSHALDAYEGTYADRGYGQVGVERRGNGLILRYNGMELPLRHYHYDTFETRVERWDQTILVTFHADTRGDIARVQASLEPTGRDIVFHRVADPSLRERAYLERCVGRYDLMGAPVHVTLQGDGLQLAIAGQPPYDLHAIGPDRFGVRDRSALSVRFVGEETRVAREIEIHQAGSTYLAQRVDGDGR